MLDTLKEIIVYQYTTAIFSPVLKHVQTPTVPNAHSYANDSQIYLSFRLHSPASRDTVLWNIKNCVVDVHTWMLSNRRLINDTKTEFVIIRSHQQISTSYIDEITIKESIIKPVKVVHNLGAWFDSHMSMNSHIGKVCDKAFSSHYNIQQSRKFLSEETTKILVHAFIT